MIKVENGILYFDGCNTVDLAKKYGTPLYLISKNSIQEKIAELRESFLDKYEGARVAFASKAFCTKAMIKLCEKEGLCIDVVSGGELYTAMAVNFPAERIEFNGNNKLPSELVTAIEYGVGRIIIDGLQELDIIEKICKEKSKKVNILFRVTPGVSADSHDYMVTGKKDSKFGIPLDEEVLFPQIDRAIHSPYINFLGFHFHVGAQLLDNSPYLQAVDIVMEQIRKVKEKLGYGIEELNIGGGFGIAYSDEERKPFSYYLDPVMERIKTTYKELGIPAPALVIEPGRGIVGEAGMTLYTIGSIKNIKGVRKYVSVDGGMTDLIRPALYQAVHDGVVANKAENSKTERVTICGKCCESGDILIKDCNIAKETAPGDIFAIFTTGAYGFSMASNYNRIPIPAVVLLNNGKDELIVRRQSFGQLIENDLLPESMK